MAEFSDKLLLAIQKDESVYDSFFRICREDLPNDADERYQWLRSNGYVARDEADIDVYVAKVAARHKPKFRWLYDKLFEKFSNIFQGEIDLVVWGCGCGLDLLALYDRAMQQNNPQLWLTVRSVTLTDISAVALKRAKEIADVLFPMARSKINTFVCDFKDSSSIHVEIPRSFIYTPRLHLVSNVIDLLSGDQLCQFAQMQRNTCVRSYYGKRFFNEMFVAFSPEYKNWDWVATKLKMDKYRQIWGEKSSDMIVGGGELDKCAYATFSLNDCSRSVAYQAYYNGNRCLRNLVRERNRCLDEGADDKALKGLQKALFNIVINEKGFFDCYEWVDVQTWENRQGEDRIGRLLFVPSGNTDISPCLVVFFTPRDALDIKNKAWKELFKKVGLENSDILGPGSVTKILIWRNGLLAGDIDYRQYRMGSAQDFSEAFVVNLHGAKPLPDVDKEMDRKQKDVIFGRAQLRRIRGGAGCGKTTTMLWHGVMSILRMHLPVLMACRTVTLFNHNRRRMAATLLAKINGLEYVERRLIQFKTIDKYLCDSFLWDGKCFVRNSKEQNLSDEDKKQLCRGCKACHIKELIENRDVPAYERLGAVMVDEIQSVEPNMVQALYNLTEKANPNREFYAFCDERQCLESGAVEKDVDVGKFRVKTPKTRSAKRFNPHWISFNKPYRQLGEFSGTLEEVASAFQRLVEQKYGKDETERQLFQPGIVNVFSVESVDNCSLIYPAVKSKIEFLKNNGESRITVICDIPGIACQLFELGKESNNWLSTHRQGATFSEEQRRRDDFEETEDHIGLTTIKLAQGWDFECVILVVTQDACANEHVVESVLTGITRAKRQLRIIDVSPSHWVYNLLKKYN